MVPLIKDTWCEIIVPILWKNPWKYLEEDEKEKSQLNVENVIRLSRKFSKLEINSSYNTNWTNLIENTKGYLIEISLYDKYYEEFNKLLIICQNLIGLIIHDASIEGLNWGKLFEILTNSSPNNLYKFKFEFNYYVIKLETFKLFFNNWKGRNPMLLHFPLDGYKSEYFDLIIL
ncbi:hypothetical protein RhiirB3_440477 [Rhizophagus irregularis]|nr:hypothetical protein RhiirB3_440477 [Rhizophagus irregularis]